MTERDESGVWTVTTPPVIPGFHYYTLSIDGVKVNDPASDTFFGTGRPTSGIEVPEKGVDFYYAKDVPHGEVPLEADSCPSDLGLALRPCMPAGILPKCRTLRPVEHR